MATERPRADSMQRVRWTAVFEGGLDAVFRDDPNTVVASGVPWYPVEGEPGTVMTPGVFVVLGRPRGWRASYKQWAEDRVAPQVVFEILSDSDDYWAMLDKQDFYETHGVEEYYLYHPRSGKFWCFLREGDALRRAQIKTEWTSPRLKVRFVVGPELEAYGPNGHRFAAFEELLYERCRRAEAQVEQLAALLRQHGIDPNQTPPG